MNGYTETSWSLGFHGSSRPFFKSLQRLAPASSSGGNSIPSSLLFLHTMDKYLDPTPEQIAARAAEIRATWDSYTERERWSSDDLTWQPPANEDNSAEK